MVQLFKTLSLAPKSIKRKLIVAFALMSLIPMFVFGYFIFYYILPTTTTFWQIFSVFVITIFLMLSGFYLAKKIIYPIIAITAHAKGIAGGELTEELQVDEEDEIGELSSSLNQLATRLKTNMTELRDYGEKIKQINMEINRKVFALSSLLQIGNLITASTNLDEVFNLVVEKLSQLEGSGATFLLLKDLDGAKLSLKASANVKGEEIRQLKIKIGQGPLGKVLQNARSLLIDTQKRPKALDENLQIILQMVSNIAIVPITSSGKIIGMLGTGNNRDNYIFLDDEIELIRVFAKQVAVAIENDLLLRKTEELAVRDELTGLYNENYIRTRLDEEIRRSISYQRPCSFMILQVNNFQRYRDMLGEIVAEKDLKRIAQILKQGTGEIDKVGRFSDHQFAVILPEKNKGQSRELVSNIKTEIERSVFKQKTTDCNITLSLSAGISATPVDGATALELINQALNYTRKE